MVKYMWLKFLSANLRTSYSHVVTNITAVIKNVLNFDGKSFNIVV